MYVTRTYVQGRRAAESAKVYVFAAQRVLGLQPESTLASTRALALYRVLSRHGDLGHGRAAVT